MQDLRVVGRAAPQDPPPVGDRCILVGKHGCARGDISGRPCAPDRGLERSLSECGIVVDRATRTLQDCRLRPKLHLA
jgi:hypothetical protein